MNIAHCQHLISESHPAPGVPRRIEKPANGVHHYLVIAREGKKCRVARWIQASGAAQDHVAMTVARGWYGRIDGACKLVRVNNDGVEVDVTPEVV